MSRSRLVQGVLVALGLCALGLGAVGIFVPLLPTTPFLLLAAACFFRSSERLYTWLIQRRWVGDYIRNYREHRAMTRRAKLGALALLWGVIGLSAVMAARSVWLRLLLAAVAVGVTLHLLQLRTVPRSAARHPGQDDAAGVKPRQARRTATGRPHKPRPAPCHHTDTLGAQVSMPRTR